MPPVFHTNQSNIILQTPDVYRDSGPRENVVAWLVLFALVTLIGVINMPATFWPGDPSIWREETRSILAHGMLSVGPEVVAFSGEPGETLIQNPRNGLMYSKYGLMNALMSLPPMLVDRVFLGGSMRPVTNPNIVIFNLWNIALSLALAAVLMKIAGLYTGRAVVKVLFVLSVFYGTYLWYYLRAQSSELYQALFYAIFFFSFVTFLRRLEVGSIRISRLYFAWLAIAALVFTRVSYGLLIPLSGILVVIAILRLAPSSRMSAVMSLWPHVLVPPLAILTALGLLNFVRFGAPWLSGYHMWHARDHLPTWRIDQGLWGLLFRRQYSLLLYFPPVTLGLVAIRAFARRFAIDAIVAFGIAGTYLLFFSSIPWWTGEWTYGPRFILFALPIAAMPFVLVLDWMFDQPKKTVSFLLGGVFALILIYSGYLQFRVNSVRFFAFQQIRRNLSYEWPEPIRAYFEDHHVGRTIDDLVRHRDSLDETALFIEARRHASPDMMDQIRSMVRSQCDPQNYFWWADAAFIKSR